MKRIALLAIALALVSGCILFPQPDRYALFSYLPSEGAKAAVFVDLKESAFTEITSLLGTVLSGKAKDIKGMQIAVLSYDDGSSAGIVQMRTALGIEDAISGIPSYYLGIVSTPSEFVNESRVIGDKNVTLLYTKYDTGKKNPICTWREGEWLKVLYYQRAYSSSYSQCTFPPGFSCVSYTLNQSGELYLKVGQGTGHEVKINSILCNASGSYYEVPDMNAPLENSITLASGSSADLAGGSSGNTVVCSGISGGYFSGKIYINYSEVDTGLNRVAVGTLSTTLGGRNESEKRCDTILENKYDTGTANKLLQESAGIGNSIAPSGNIFGEGMAYSQNKSTYVAVFGDDNGDYGVGISNAESSGNNLCYTSGGKAEVVTRGDKQACVTDYGGIASMYPIYALGSLGGGKQFLSIQRNVGNYSVMLAAYAKDNEDKVKSKAEDIIFGVNLPGDEMNWTDKMNLHVKVYETFGGSFDQQPVADAKVELYNESYAYPVYNSNGVRNQEPIKTVYTNDNGIADFNNLDVGSYTLSISKPGYSKDTTYVYPVGSTNISIMLQPIQPIRVTVRESAAYTNGGSYYGNVIAGAKVDLYNNTGGGYSSYSSSYTLIKTVYTDDNGVADFGKIGVDDGKVEVTKEGYSSDTEYVSSYSRNLTAYLTKSYNYNYYNYSGEAFTVTVLGYDSSGSTLKNIEGAKVDIYNETSAGTYMLAMTNYTDSNGVARLSGGNIATGKIAVEKNGYGTYTEYFYYYNTRNMAISLLPESIFSNRSSIYNETSAPAENCSGNYSVRIWPSGAPRAACQDSSGGYVNSTGANSAEWFNYGGAGCGDWKAYNVTSGSQIKLHAYGDNCTGCSLFYIDYNLDDYYNSTWNDMGRVKGPEQPGDTYYFCYTPKGSLIRVRSTNGFYLQVFKKS
jgi:hypothetical protein